MTNRQKSTKRTDFDHHESPHAPRLDVFLVCDASRIESEHGEDHPQVSSENDSRSRAVVFIRMSLFNCSALYLDLSNCIPRAVDPVLNEVGVSGWAMQTAVFMFIRRRWEEDEATLKRFVQY